MGQSLPPAAVLVSHQVADFDRWKAGFDEHEETRRAAGIVGHHVNRADDDPNRVSIYLAVADIEKAKAFSESQELKDYMAGLGVVSQPEMTWVTPAREAVIWDRVLPAILVSHSVADFATWLEGYNAADEMRTSKGIIGHAANRSMDDPSRVMIYHQAESFDTLRDFLADPDLKAVMADAGVTSEPEVTYVNGGWGKQY